MNVFVIILAFAAAPAEAVIPEAPEAASTPPVEPATDGVDPADTESIAIPEPNLDSPADRSSDTSVQSDELAEEDRPAPTQAEPTEQSVAVQERFRVARSEREAGLPFYTEEDDQAFRQRFALEANPPPPPAGARWRCLIADPTCGTSFEINATSAYAYRGRQGAVDGTGGNLRWHSAQVQYDLWLNLPVVKETRGRARFTRMTFGPKGGVLLSDTGDTWGNLGVAGRYWLGRGRWAATIEFTSALTYKLASRDTRGDTAKPKLRMTRGPIGLAADVGVGIGGFGAIILGGQYDAPLAREDVPESVRTHAAGMFFVGFRGNIAWGAPAAAAVATHVAANKSVTRPKN